MPGSNAQHLPKGLGASALKPRLIDPVTLNPVSKQNAYYIVPNVHKGKPRGAYHLDTLEKLLRYGGGVGVSPLTRRRFTERNIRKVQPANPALQRKYQRAGATILSAMFMKNVTRIKQAVNALQQVRDGKFLGKPWNIRPDLYGRVVARASVGGFKLRVVYLPNYRDDKKMDAVIDIVVEKGFARLGSINLTYPWTAEFNVRPFNCDNVDHFGDNLRDLVWMVGTCIQSRPAVYIDRYMSCNYRRPNARTVAEKAIVDAGGNVRPLADANNRRSPDAQYIPT